MKPENFQQKKDSFPDTTPDNTNLANAHNSILAPLQDGSITGHVKARKRSKRLYIATLLLLGVIILSGYLTWNVFSKQEGGSAKIQFFGNEIPQVNCRDLKGLAQDSTLLMSNKDNYQCFKGSFNADDEKMEYAVIQLDPEFSNEWDKKCTLDCGSSPGDYPPETVNLGTFIIRANGKIKNYQGFGGGGVESLLSDLTGCGTHSSFGILNKLKDGKLVIDDDRLGLLSQFTGLEVTDSLGNNCTMDLELVSYLTSNTENGEFTDSIKVKKVAVRYDLKDTALCANEAVPSSRQSCFTAQATLRNDVTICESLSKHTSQSNVNNGFDNCVIAVAKRNRNPQLCDKIRYYREQFLATCQTDTKKLKLVSGTDIIIK